ncbi:hypothetical protein [Actinacidiphila sp. bgisy167]|uniref:hypothetical protein n=1 Tax=Actinacidiphila sp. bgisy167 TaxID=3413797 RepID=UPI003D71D342
MSRTSDDAIVPPDPEQVDPGVLVALLARHGWRRRGGAPGRYTRWTPPGDGESMARTSLLVPERSVPGAARYADHSELLGEALHALARCGEPSAREVLTALAVPGDEIRWHREPPPAAGAAVPWTAAEQLRAAARAMLMSAARAEQDRFGYFGARHTGHAAALLERVLVGDAPGHRLTAYVPVTEGRGTVATMLRALQATRDAVDYQRATGRMEAFDAAVGLGVCHELADSLVRMVRGTEGVLVSLAWAPAAGPPTGFTTVPEPVEFSPGDLPALVAASERYVRAEPPVDVRVTGTVTRLRRPRPTGGGTIRLRVLAGADVRHIRVVLPEEGYRIAAQAHLVGLPVRLSGRLERRTGFRHLTHPSAPVPVHVDEADRDRLLKALHGGVDTFEDSFGG